MAAYPDLRILRNFVAVATAGSISRAAELRHIAQPALSLQMRNLEESLGVRLFERTSRGVMVTAAGERLLAHALAMLERMEAAIEDVQGAADEPLGTVAVGLPLSVARYLATPLVRTVLARHPGIRLQLFEVSTGYIPEMLVKGQIDLGFTFAGSTEG